MIYFRCPACGIYHESSYQVPRMSYEARKWPSVADLEFREECPNTGRKGTYRLSETRWQDAS